MSRKEVLRLDNFTELEKRQMKTISEFQEKVKKLNFDITQYGHDIKELESKIELLERQKADVEERCRDLYLQLKQKNSKIGKALRLIKKEKENAGIVYYIGLHDLEVILEDEKKV